MKYEALKITDRVKRIKDTYMSLRVPSTRDPYNPVSYKPYLSGDRHLTLGYLRGYLKYSDVLSTRLRTSYAEAEELYQAKPLIYGDELLLGHIYLPEFTEEEQREYDSLYERFKMSSHSAPSARRDHICLDFEKLLRVGVGGLKREIRERLDAIDTSVAGLYPDMENVKKYEFYQCCLIELEAVSDLARRYSEEALRLANEVGGTRADELTWLGNMLKKVPENPAESFYEALQSVQFFLCTLFGLFPLGRPDRYLYPYYKKDIENGSLTKEFAQELIDNFCLYVSDRVFSRAACGFIVGGVDADGSLVENDLTYMFITALDHLKLPDPNGALAYRKNTGEELLAYAAEVLSHGTSHPAFYNDEAIIASLVNNYGVEPADAVNYIHSTCAEISIAGKSKALSTPFQVDLPRELDLTVRSGEFKNIDELISAYLERLHTVCEREMWSYGTRILEAARVGNDAMRIATLIDDCIARGKSVYEGGEKYMFLQPIFVGFATVVDSLCAIRELVYNEKRLTLSEFSDIVSRNFEGEQRLRQYIIHKISHYGNDDERADKLAARIAEGIHEIMFERGGGCMREHIVPGTFSYINHATLGEAMGATFDARLSGASYSDGCGAVQGRDVCGPGAMVLSLTSWEQSWLLGGMVVNMKFAKDNLCGEKVANFLTIVRTFMERGGIELQVNVVDRATLEDAKINPEAHRDLIVRIGGYSDYFVRLRPSLQDEIIARTEY